MAINERLFVLFPHQTLPERDLGQLALFIPKLHLLQVLEPLPIPAWGAARFEILPAGLGEIEAEQLRQARESFREFAAVHQDHCLAASYTSETFLRQDLESRLDIQSSLKGREAKPPGAGNRQMLEAALFLEMALEFDRKQADLESDLAEAAHLETEFREILGINDDDTIEDSLETLSPPLASTRAHLSFMLSKRIVSWLRVLSRASAASAGLALVTVTQEVVDEVIDRVEAFIKRHPSAAEWSQAPPAAIPCIPGLLSGEAAEKLEAVQRADHYLNYRRSLEALLDDPGSDGKQEALRNAAEHMTQAIEADLGPGGPQCPVRQLVLTSFSNLSLADFKLALDPGGDPPPPEWADRPAPPLLCLRDLPATPLPDDEMWE